MKQGKQSKLINFDLDFENKMKGYVRDLDGDVTNLFLGTQNRTRFGESTDGATGENVSGQRHEFTTSATPGTETTIAHTIGSIPTGRIVMYQDKPGSLVNTPTSGTNWTTTNVYFSCDSASVTFNIFLTK